MKYEPGTTDGGIPAPSDEASRSDASDAAEDRS